MARKNKLSSEVSSAENKLMSKGTIVLEILLILVIAISIIAIFILL